MISYRNRTMKHPFPFMSSADSTHNNNATYVSLTFDRSAKKRVGWLMVVSCISSKKLTSPEIIGPRYFVGRGQRKGRQKLLIENKQTKLGFSLVRNVRVTESRHGLQRRRCVFCLFVYIHKESVMQDFLRTKIMTRRFRPRMKGVLRGLLLLFECTFF